jgi:ATP-binding cassette subfamily B protein
LEEVIAGLSEGLKTMVGERGTMLSGGQKQRVAIARALVRDPMLLVLDEATSALDNESERQVQAALDAARTGRTSVVIAHRLTTVRNADLIVVLDQGRVVEQGTWAELAPAGGYFTRLLEAAQKGRLE